MGGLVSIFGAGTALISAILILVGLVIAVAGRDLHHAVIAITGFLVGFFIIAGVYIAPGALSAWESEDMVSLVLTLGIGLILAVVVGYIGMQLAWIIYKLLIQLPGFIAGGIIGVVIFSPLEQSLDFIFVFALAAIGAIIVWKLHNIFIVIHTALFGGTLVGLGLSGIQINQLPIVQTPMKLLESPIDILWSSITVSRVFAATTLLVFLGGMALQFNDRFILPGLGILPDNIIEGPTPEESTSSESSQPTPQSQQRDQQSDQSESDSGFYTK